MDEDQLPLPPAPVISPQEIDRSARDMVGSLDRILSHMIAAAPAEREGWEIPLTLREVWAAKTIGPKNALSMSALAASMGVSLPTATHLVDRLVAKGVVVRTRSEQDRRLVLVALSNRSKMHDQQYRENRVAVVRKILETLSPAEREQAVSVFSKIAQLVEANAPGLPGHAEPL